MNASRCVLSTMDDRKLSFASVPILLLVVLLLLTIPIGQAAPVEARASGGGLVGGDPGLEFGGSTSQFGFVAILDRGGNLRGHFNCLMAGFSGGFAVPGTPIQQVLLMQVVGDIQSLRVREVAGLDVHGHTVSGTLATIEGVSIVTIIGKTADGDVVRIVMELPYVLEVLAGGPGTGVLHLEHPDLELHTGGLLEHGRIDVRAD